MKAKLLCLLVGWILGSTVFAGIQTREVSYDQGGVTFKGYLAWDDAVAGKRPGVLVVHEWWGHNAYARSRAEKLAALGYTALAVDMYGDGKQADHPKDAGTFAKAVMSDVENAKARFLAAKATLNKEASVDPERTAAIGYCFGGGVVLHMARMGVDLDGVVSFHGSLGTEHPAEKGKTKARILVCHGADDPFIPEAAVAGFKKEMEAAEADYLFKAYEGASHSFTNPGATEMGKKFDLPIAYDQQADEQSWKGMQTFLTGIFNPTPAVFRHLVLFKFKEDASAEDIAELEKAFRTLPDKVESITDFEWGKDTEGDRTHGFTHRYLITFKDRAGLDAYMPHPAHQAFVKLLKPKLEDVLVMDFVPEP